MNIKHYYKKTANVYLNISLFSLLISGGVFFFALFFLTKREIWVSTTPFMLLSCLYFANYVVYTRRFESLPDELDTSKSNLLEEENILMTFMPAPTLRVLLFTPKGKLVGEICDYHSEWYHWLIPNSLSAILPHTYVLKDQNQRTLATYKLSSFMQNSMSIFNESEELIAHYKENWKKSFFRFNGEVINADGCVRMNINISGFLQSFTISSIDNRNLVSFQKGWMNLEWGEKFKELNTPILSFTSVSTNEDKLCIYGICARLLNHRKN
ncbi:MULTISPECIES: hypothetical protein [Bacillus]|uniref:hypothetical protein n=1 Tax=Bacillus TaxID=1386 RepID=UPI0002FDE5A9|nr:MULTISPECIES: hypothetical protein [Bacillus]